jgi:hypothetical protein
VAERAVRAAATGDRWWLCVGGRLLIAAEAAERRRARRMCGGWLFCRRFSRMLNASQQKRLLRSKKLQHCFLVFGWKHGEELCDPGFAAARNSFLPFGVSRTKDARRLCGSAARSTKPSASSSSVRPVMLPVITIRRLEISPMRRPTSVASSCAIRSKRERLILNEARSHVMSLCTAIMRHRNIQTTLPGEHNCWKKAPSKEIQLPPREDWRGCTNSVEERLDVNAPR